MDEVFSQVEDSALKWNTSRSSPVNFLLLSDLQRVFSSTVGRVQPAASGLCSARLLSGLAVRVSSPPPAGPAGPRQTLGDHRRGRRRRSSTGRLRKPSQEPGWSSAGALLPAAGVETPSSRERRLHSGREVSRAAYRNVEKTSRDRSGQKQRVDVLICCRSPAGTAGLSGDEGRGLSVPAGLTSSSEDSFSFL